MTALAKEKRHSEIAGELARMPSGAAQATDCADPCAAERATTPPGALTACLDAAARARARDDHGYRVDPGPEPSQGRSREKNRRAQSARSRKTDPGWYRLKTCSEIMKAIKKACARSCSRSSRKRAQRHLRPGRRGHRSAGNLREGIDRRARRPLAVRHRQRPGRRHRGHRISQERSLRTRQLYPTAIVAQAVIKNCRSAKPR